MIDPKTPYIMSGFTAVKEDVPDILLTAEQSPDNRNVETDTMQGVITKKLGFKSIGKMGSVLLLDNCEVTTNWTFSTNITGSLDTSNPVVGSKDIQMAVGTFGTGIMAYKNISSVDLSAYSGVGFYIKSSQATNAGDYQFIISSASGGATPVETVNVPALVASVWQYVYLPFANAGSTRTAVLSFALKIAVSQNNETLNIDNLELVRSDDFPIDTCTAAWTGNTGVTTTLESFPVISNSGVTQQATSVKNVMASSFTTGLIASHTFSAIDISLYGYVGIWIYSVQGLYGGALTLKLSSAGGVIESILIKDLLPAGQWTRINLSLSTPSSDNAIITASLYANVNLGGYTVYLGGIRAMKPVVATNEYIRTDGSKIMMASNGTNVYASVDGGATFTVVAGGLNNSYFAWMNTFSGECFWGNGYDWNMKYTLNSQTIVYSATSLNAYYMPKARFMWSHQSSIAMLLYAGSPVTIRYSDPAILSSEALWFPAGRQYDADTETGDYLVCAKDFGERSVVFLSNSFIILSGSDQSSFQWLPRNFGIGCTVRDSVQIKDEAYMIFANEKGVYRMDESFVPLLISDSIKTSYKNLNQPSINNSMWEQSTEPEFESGTYGNLIDTTTTPGKIMQKGQTAFDDWYLASSTTTDVVADGYTTTTIDLCEVAWTGASGVTVVVDPYIYYQGSGSVLLEVETANTGILAYHNFSAIDLSSRTILPTPQGYVSLWVYATAGTGIPSGSMSLLLSDSAGGASPKETLVIDKFCPPLQWTNVILKLANQANDTAIISAAISANSSLLHARIWIDNIQGVLFNGGCNVSTIPVALGKVYNPYFAPAVNDKGGAIFNDPVIGQGWALTASNMNQGWFYCSGTPVPTPFVNTIPAPPGSGATFLWWQNNIGQNTYPYMLYAEVGGFVMQVQGIGLAWTPWTITQEQILSGGNTRGSLITLTFSGQYNMNGVTAASNASQSFYWTGGDITFATYFQYYTNFGVYWGVANVALTAPSSLATWYKVAYPADGTIITQALNHGFKPSTMGTLTANVEVAPGTSIDFYARSNSVNSGWSGISWTLLGTATSSSPFSADLSVITTNQYLEVEAVLHNSADGINSPILRSIYVGTQYLSIQHNIGVHPTKWGQFISSDNANGKTITYGLATAPTQGGLNIDPSLFTPIVTNTGISAPVQNTWVQVLVTLDTDNYLYIPTVDSFQLNWTSGVSTTLPTTLMTSIVWDRKYYLFGQTQGDSYNNTGFCLDKNWTWQKMSGFPCGSCFLFNESPYFGGSFSGRIFSLFTGNNADYSDWVVPIESYWNTYRTGLDEKGMDKWYTELVIFYEPVSAGSVDIYYDLNNTGDWTFWGTIDLTQNKGEARLLTNGFLKGRDLRLRIYNNNLSETLTIYKMWLFHEIYERIY